MAMVHLLMGLSTPLTTEHIHCGRHLAINQETYVNTPPCGGGVTTKHRTMRSVKKCVPQVRNESTMMIAFGNVGEIWAIH